MKPRKSWKFSKHPNAPRQRDSPSAAATRSAAHEAAGKPAANSLDADGWSSDEEDRQEQAAHSSASGRAAAGDGMKRTNGEEHRASRSGCGTAAVGRAGGADEARAAALVATMAGPQRLAKLTANARLSSGQSRTAHKRTGGGGAPGLKPGEPGRFSPV